MTADASGLLVQLRSTLGRMEVALGAIADAIAWTDGRGNLQWCNQPFSLLVGLSKIDLVGSPLVGLLPLETERGSIGAEAHPVALVIAGAERASAIAEYRRGERGWMLNISATRIDVGDDGRGAIVVIHDVTEQKRAEAVLLESEEKFRAIASSAQDAIVMIDEAGNVSFWNAAAERVFGYRWDEVRGCGLHTLLAPESSRAAYQRGFQRFRKTGRGLLVGNTQELIALRRDGQQFPVEVSIAALQRRGEWNAIGIMRDITERKRAESELQLGARVIESALEAIIVTDARGVIERVNPAFTELTGYAAKEAVGKTPGILKSGWHDRDFYQRIWRALADSGRWQGDIWNRRKDGSAYLQWLSVSAIKDPDGHVTHYVGIGSDDTQRRLLEERLERLAFFDALTGLPNRMLFYDRLGQILRRARRRNEGAAVIFFDLDGFKRVNDDYGHEAGDSLLREVGDRLRKLVREEDTVARVGGDEFTVVLASLKRAQDAAAVAEKIVGGLSEPYHIDGRTYSIGTSVGIGLFPGDGQDPDTLVRAADAAMYRAKRSGGNGFRFAAG